MEVLSYKKLKNNLYEVIMSNGDKYKLYDDVILKFELLLDKDVDQKKLNRILEENQKIDAYFKALKFLNTKMRTELEVRKYLSKYEFEKSKIDYAINHLKDDGYLNEEKYVQAFVNDAINLTLNGPKKIEKSLEVLGINSYLIREYLDRISHEAWISRIDKYVEKKARINKYSEKMFKSKVYSELMILGYYSVDVKDVLDSFKIDTNNVFLSEANKIYEKLIIKYSGIELELQFKSKMYVKGFSEEQINNYIQSK